jgi:hypothetical protein
MRRRPALVQQFVNVFFQPRERSATQARVPFSLKAVIRHCHVLLRQLVNLAQPGFIAKAVLLGDPLRVYPWIRDWWPIQ